MRVSNMQSPRSGSPVANQYEIQDGNTSTFQSYQTVIAKNDGGVFTISNDWNYSRTTARYFYQWLRQWNFDGADIDNLKKWLRQAKAGDVYDDFDDYTVKFVEAL